MQRAYIRWNGVARRVIRFTAPSGSEVIGVTPHGSGSLRLNCVGVLEHALRVLPLKANAGQSGRSGRMRPIPAAPRAASQKRTPRLL
jgi:hypothetical protein